MHVKQSWLPLTTAMCGLYVAKSFQLLTLRLSMLCCDRLVLEGTRVLCVMHLIHIIWEVDSEVDSEIDSEVDSEAGSDVVDLHFCYCIHCICSPLATHMRWYHWQMSIVTSFNVCCRGHSKHHNYIIASCKHMQTVIWSIAWSWKEHVCCVSYI